MSASLTLLQRQRASALVEEMQDDLEEYAFRLVEAEDSVESLQAEVERLTKERDQIIERCAEVCDSLERQKWETVRDGGKLDGFSAKDCAAAIRAMKNDPVA